MRLGGQVLGADRIELVGLSMSGSPNLDGRTSKLVDGQTIKLVSLAGFAVTKLPAVDFATDAEHVSVRVTDMHLPHAPGLIGGWMGDVELLGEASLMYLVDVIDPEGHPYPFVCSLAGPWAGLNVRPTAPTALSAAA